MYIQLSQNSEKFLLLRKSRFDLHSPGAMRGRALTAGTLRLMFIARTSVTAALSVFFPPSVALSEELDFPPVET